jgi:hypothetical protein
MAVVLRPVALVLGCILVFPSYATAASSYDIELMRLMSYGQGFAHALVGTAKRVSSRKEPNRHVLGEFVEIVTERIPGVEISWLLGGADRKARFLYSLSVTGRNIHVPVLKIGVSIEADIVSYFGPPQSRTTTVLTYEVPAEANADSLIFRLRNGRLSRIDWGWFIE